VPLPDDSEPQPTLVTLLHAGNAIVDPNWTGGTRRVVARVRTQHVVEFEPLAGHPDSVTVPMGTRVQALGARRRLHPVQAPLPGQDELERSWDERDLTVAAGDGPLYPRDDLRPLRDHG
jgi:hypothetical protein